MLFKWFSRLYHAVVFIILLGIFVNIFAPILVEASPISNAFINEIHYDNSGGDQNESIEIVGNADLDLTSWSLHLYNGSNGSEYNSFNLGNWSTIDSDSNIGFFSIMTAGLQNGSPDGIALYDGLNFIQFLSYEGTFTATTGIASGLTSIDIGVFESSATPLGSSLQLTGAGLHYNDFTWAPSQQSTFGTVNLKQNFIAKKDSVISVSEPNSLALLLLAFLFLSSETLKQYGAKHLVK
ncbi:MAG: hypothetical protein COB83_12310 [Gammaproteobacteria bacterium]|nr:MAG: hypothetical protein COB83_12310 [Gammaproteobacteria bacterium]